MNERDYTNFVVGMQPVLARMTNDPKIDDTARRLVGEALAALSQEQPDEFVRLMIFNQCRRALEAVGDD